VTFRALAAVLFCATGPLLAGCAREAQPPEVPGMRVAEALPDPLTFRFHRGRHGLRSLAIPDGEACLVTPVAVTGPIGGVRYESAGVTSLVCDCRLAVALDSVAPELRSFGIKEVQHSGAYVFRTTRSGRPSLHALGLAIDVHRIHAGAHRLDVSRDYARGQGPSCEQSSPVLNRLACELDRTGLFEQVITPDDDSDHRDHLHLAIAPL
jgi:hypothetical protein